MANSSSFLSDSCCVSDVITDPSTSNNKLINRNNNNSNNSRNLNNIDNNYDFSRNNKTTTTTNTIINKVEYCNDPISCLSLKDILKSFNAPISEEQAWSIIYQSIRIYYDLLNDRKKQQNNCCVIRDIRLPLDINYLNIHKDGTVHITVNRNDQTKCIATSQKKILLKLGLVVYQALDYNLPSDEECIISSELEQVINYMTLEDADDEGIERDSEDVEDEKFVDTKELDHVLELCKPRVSSSNPEDHYKAVCRALATESLDLRVFLQKVFQGDAESLRLKAHAETSQLELSKLCFSDWARFWMQVVDELRRGVRLKKSNCSRTPVEFELTPYEILMEDIRTRKYNLRKVMINGDIPQTVKKDAHAVILEFIRSRPPLRKASERKLQPLKRNPSPREQLLDSIRQGRILKPVPKLKSRLSGTGGSPESAQDARDTMYCPQEKSSKIPRAAPRGNPPTPKPRSVLPTSQLDSLRKTSELNEANLSPRRQQRLIPVDFSLFQDDENVLFNGPIMGTSTSSVTVVNLPPSSASAQSQHHSSKTNNENNQNNINTILRRTRNTITQEEYHRFCDTALESYDLATQCESRRASMRRHTIVGCQSSTECQSMPPSRPESRQSELSATTTTTAAVAAVIAGSTLGPTSGASSSDTWAKNSLDEKQWKDSMNVNDRLSLTLEEIVHIRSVMTKAELEGLPVGVRVKEDVERKKVCFLCLRTRFSIFGQWGVQCKLCHRTVCSKCYTKMRIPTEHFRNVPVVLLSPSLMNSPVTSQTPSPSHHAHHSGGPSSLVDENFPRSLMERLMRPELERKTRNTVGSAPSSPKHQRSASSTPGPEQQQNHMSLSIASNGVGVLGAKINNCNNSNNSNCNSIMSRSMEGPRSLPPPQSPARPHSNNSTLDRRNRFAKAFTLTSSAGAGHSDQKELLRGEMMAVCNDCRGLVLEIIRSSRQTRSTARNQAIRNLTLDLSPVYKRCIEQLNILILEEICYSIDFRIPKCINDNNDHHQDIFINTQISNKTTQNKQLQLFDKRRRFTFIGVVAASATILIFAAIKKC